MKSNKMYLGQRFTWNCKPYFSLKMTRKRIYDTAVVTNALKGLDTSVGFSAIFNMGGGGGGGGRNFCHFLFVLLHSQPLLKSLLHHENTPI